MFTGIVETIGKIGKIIQRHACISFCISPCLPFLDLNIGDSVAVNGVCLTVNDFDDTHFYVTAVPETLNLTNLKDLMESDYVNLERAMKSTARVGGHLIQGHVDAPGTIAGINKDLIEVWTIKIKFPSSLGKYIVKKGFIGLDGMSLTVTEVSAEYFSIALIPHTIQATIAKEYKIGKRVNIEVDMIAKYIEKQMRASHVSES